MGLKFFGYNLEGVVLGYRESDIVTDKPTVVFAYEGKGLCVPVAGDPLNQAALLS